MINKKLPKPKIAETISIVSYQFKAPISAIKGSLESLVAEDCGEINSLQKEYLSDALKNLKKISNFVEDFLDIQRIKEKTFKIKLAPVSLDDAVAKVLADSAVWIRATNCEIELAKPEVLPQVLTDPARINMVIHNLISNAVKYSRTGKGKVKITLQEKGKQVFFICEDDGIGISQKDFKKVFSKFYRSEKAMKVDTSAAGLGLHINKAVVELSGGKLKFSKNKGAGMTFYFSLPIAE